MPEYSVFFDERNESKRIQVLKVYDVAYARSCYEEMDENALDFLANSLGFECLVDDEGVAFSFEDVEEEAREDGNLLSFFVVIEQTGKGRNPVYVSPDWPSAEKFAKDRLSGPLGIQFPSNRIAGN
jgi:hypothetical protein